MIEYVKIPNIFKRETFGNNKLIEGEYSSKELEYLKGAMWEFTEKIDGTNVRVCWDGYRVSFMGRTDKAKIPGHLLSRLEEIFGGESKEELFEQTFGKKNVILFGEGYGKKIQKGGELYGDVNFRLFDVYVDGYWLVQDAVDGISTVFGIETAPFMFRGTLEDGVRFIKTHPMSKLRDAEMEGIVGRPMVQMFSRTGERIMVKIKCRDF